MSEKKTGAGTTLEQVDSEKAMQGICKKLGLTFETTQISGNRPAYRVMKDGVMLVNVLCDDAELEKSIQEALKRLQENRHAVVQDRSPFLRRLLAWL